MSNGRRAQTATLGPGEDVDIAAVDTGRWLVAEMTGRALGILKSKQPTRHVTLRVAE